MTITLSDLVLGRGDGTPWDTLLPGLEWLSDPSPHRALAEGAGWSELASALVDEDHDWLIHHGDLRVDGDFVPDVPLVVEGDLLVIGDYDDPSVTADGIVGLVVVTGDLVAADVNSSGYLGVAGSLFCPGMMLSQSEECAANDRYIVGELVAARLADPDGTVVAGTRAAGVVDVSPPFDDPTCPEDCEAEARELFRGPVVDSWLAAMGDGRWDPDRAIEAWIDTCYRTPVTDLYRDDRGPASGDISVLDVRIAGRISAACTFPAAQADASRLQTAARSEGVTDRGAAAAVADELPDDLWRALGQDSSDEVRARLAGNDRLPSWVVDVLLEDVTGPVGHPLMPYTDGHLGRRIVDDLFASPCLTGPQTERLWALLPHRADNPARVLSMRSSRWAAARVAEGLVDLVVVCREAADDDPMVLRIRDLVAAGEGATALREIADGPWSGHPAVRRVLERRDDTSVR